jgi:hypothetical protein
MGIRALRPGPILAAFLSASAVAAEAMPPVDARALFYRACLNLERQELRASDTGAWIEELCRKEATLKAEQFSAADPTARRSMLAEGCTRWYERNLWRLPERLQGDPVARADYIALVCDLEAAERLDASNK